MPFVATRAYFSMQIACSGSSRKRPQHISNNAVGMTL